MNDDLNPDAVDAWEEWAEEAKPEETDPGHARETAEAAFYAGWDARALGWALASSKAKDPMS